MNSIRKALKLDPASRKMRKAQKSTEKFEKACDKAHEAEMENFLARGQAYSASSTDFTSDSIEHQKKVSEFYAERSFVLSKKMAKLRKRSRMKGVAHVAAFTTALTGTIAATVASHGVLSPLLALPGAVFTWAVADNAVERKKRRALREEMRQPAPGALQLYLKAREGEDDDEDEDEDDETELLGGVLSSC